MDINEILTHLGENREEYFNAVSPPVVQTSNFVFNTTGELRKALQNEMNAHIYTRGNNPTVAILRKKLAALEKTEDALVTGSGSSAVAGAVMSFVGVGDHVICVQKPYSWTNKLLSSYLSNFGVEYDFVDARNVNEIENKIKPNTKILYLESPNSLTFELQDLSACCTLAKKNNIMTMIDNSHCSPLYQNPADFGVDLIIHSATKYLNGHSDVVAGVICGSKNNIEKIFHGSYLTLGLIISPHDASLIIRGLRTLPIRMERSNETAFRMANELEKHPKIKQVIHPMLPSFPQYDLARKQMKGAGGLMTIQLNADSKEDVERFIGKLKKFLIAVSWGGYESLIMPSIVFHDIPGMADSPIHWTFIRFYIGLEDYDFLMSDIFQALETL